MNKNDILKMMEHAGMAYQKIQPGLPDSKLNLINDPRTDIQCVIRKSKDDALCIAFRGTDSLKDILADIRFWKKAIPYGNTSSKIRVHSGFIDGYKQPQIRERIHSFVTESINKIQLTGHSYGAALAVLCAVDLQFHYPHKDFEVCLFGCPRVGNRAFAASYNKRIFKTLRIENGNDLVTKIPSCILGYHHVGARIHIGKLRMTGFYSLSQHSSQEYYGELFHIE